MTATTDLGICRACRSMPTWTVRDSAAGRRIIIECERCERRIAAATLADAAAQWNNGEPKVPPFAQAKRKYEHNKRWQVRK